MSAPPGVVFVTRGLRGVLVQLGLAKPSSRAFVTGVFAAGLCYVAKYPREAFRRDGSIRPSALFSTEPDATDIHFLYVPIGAAAAAYLFT